MNCLRPLIRQPAPSFTAVAFSDAASDPDDGSVSAKAPRPLPSMSSGSHLLRCSGVPYFTIEPATMPLFTETPTASDALAEPTSPGAHRGGELAIYLAWHEIHEAAPGAASLGISFDLLHRFGERGHELEEVAHDAVVGDLEDVGVGILVHRDDDLRRRHPREMLDRAGDPERDVQVWRDGLPRLSHLLFVRPPARVGHGARRAGRGAERIREILDQLPVLGPLHPATGRHDRARFRERDPLTARRRRLEPLERQPRIVRGGRDLGHARRARAGWERPRASAHRDDRRERDLHRRTDLARIHRTLRFDRSVLWCHVGAIGGVGPSELRGGARSEIASIERRANEHELRTRCLRLLRDRAGPGDRRVPIALHRDDLDVAEARGLRGDLDGDTTECVLLPLGDHQDLHMTFASSWSAFATCSATPLGSPSSLKIFPPPRCGGGSIATISIFAAPGVTPRPARSFSGISFFLAFMIPGRLG